MKKNGFTLVELVVVMGMLSIMIGIIVSRVDVERSRQDTAIQSVTLAMNAAQRKSALRQHDMVIALDSDNMRVRIHTDMNNDGEVDDGEDVRYIVFDEGVMVGRSGAPAHPNLGNPMIVNTDTQDGLPSVTFHRNGSASSFMGFYLTSANGSKAEYTRALAVIRATGEVRCYTYRTGSWEGDC